MITAEEFLEEMDKDDNDLNAIIETAMIEFAKMHVRAALEAADGEVPLPYSHGVLNCYPESNIN